MSAYSSSGYAYGNAYSSANGTYNSNTTTTVTGPGSATYYSMPYSTDYYDQFAIYMVKKYNWVTSDIDILDNPSSKHKRIAALPAYAYFILLDKSLKNEKYLKINYKGQIGYIKATANIL